MATLKYTIWTYSEKQKRQISNESGKSSDKQKPKCNALEVNNGMRTTPAIEHIRQDIQDGNGYVICREDRVVAYGVISFDGEPVYKDIEGKWSNDLPYVIVHRLAIADEMKRQGMAKQFMLQAEEVSRKKGVYNFRVDTKYDNAYMLRLIDNVGIQILWRSVYRNNSARKSFRKDNPPLLPPDRHFRLYDSGSNL